MSEGNWLQVAKTAATPPGGSDVGEVIRWYSKTKAWMLKPSSFLATDSNRVFARLDQKATRDLAFDEVGTVRPPEIETASRTRRRSAAGPPA
jgi:hypothetical protein